MNDPAKIALVTTTINIPTVLALYREHDPDVAMFIAGDEKTPHDVVRDFAATLNTPASAPAIYLSPQVQQTLGYKCSDLLGWNTIGRRNIATLEALKWGADVIVFLDDDNLPLDPSYFVDFQHALTTPFNGLQASSASGWFDVGTLLFSSYDNSACPHRGFPHNKLSVPAFKPTSATVGVAAGICLGNPDISAITRIARNPTVHHCSKLLDAGIVVDNTNWTVFNSQNTAFIRELAPCFLMCPAFQRYDDIFASLIAQQYMRHHDLYVHFGQPFIWQERNQHNLLNDLAAEIWGETHILDFAHNLAVSLYGLTAIGAVDKMYDQLHLADLISNYTHELSKAWLEDVSKVL